MNQVQCGGCGWWCEPDNCCPQCDPEEYNYNVRAMRGDDPAEYDPYYQPPRPKVRRIDVLMWLFYREVREIARTR